MTYSNIINGSIEYVPRKTRDDRAVTVAVPLIDEAKELIQKHLDVSRGMLFPFISEQKYNVYIKEAFRKAGITRKVTTIDQHARGRIFRYLSATCSSAVLKSVLADYKSVNTKIHALEKEGELIRLKKGLYVVSPKVTGQELLPELIANHLYGPSYVSMESALRYYGLIPERVYAVRSMTTKHNREFKNEVGVFTYREVADDYFAVVVTQSKTDVPFLIAVPEKALCDTIIYTSGLMLRSVKAMEEYLSHDLRFDLEALRQFNVSIIEACAAAGKKKRELQILLKLIRG